MDIGTVCSSHSPQNDQKVPLDVPLAPIYNRYMNDTGLKQPPYGESHQVTTYTPIAQTRMDVLARLQNEVPKNDYNLPVLLYNPESIPPNFFSLPLPDQAE